MARTVTLLITAALFVPTVTASTPPESAALASIERLRTGNATFVANPEAALPITAARRSELAKGQTPFASVLSCADSRVPPEVVFHTGLGDLFVVRSAGEVTDKSVIASLEYAAEHLHSPVIVVMGHESCGAVKAAIETPAGTSLGVNLDYLLKAIRPSVAATASEPETRRLRAAILKNVEGAINDLLAHSPMLQHMLDEGEIGVVGAYYELTSGRAHFSEPVVRTPGGRQ
jgi:carbonic anhydrase